MGAPTFATRAVPEGATQPNALADLLPYGLKKNHKEDPNHKLIFNRWIIWGFEFGG